jgi:hypothetical protein
MTSLETFRIPESVNRDNTCQKHLKDLEQKNKLLQLYTFPDFCLKQNLN